MCRLLAWAGVEPVTVVDALGEEELRRFTALSLAHADGWGAAWWPAGVDSVPLSVRSTTSAARDPEFDSAMRSIRSDLGFVHLRWATPGLPVVPENTHPFVFSQWAFAHNGAIHPQARLHELLEPRWAARLQGTTDSERYFLALMAALERGMGVEDAVSSVVGAIFDRFQPTSLNAMLLGPDALYVVSAFHPDRVPPQRWDADEVAQPHGVFYDLHHRQGGSTTVVASSGLGQNQDTGWAQLRNMSLLRIERGTLDVTTVDLEVGAAALR